jgi:hypothetical protein
MNSFAMSEINMDEQFNQQVNINAIQTVHTTQVTKLKENFRSFWLYNVEYAFYWSDPVF